MPPEVSVIIVNYNGARWLPGCLAALAADTSVSKEVIVVDNASCDDSAAVIAQHDRVRFVPQSRNLGFAGGNNAGAREARGRWLAFLNNDTVPRAGWLASLKRVLEADPSLGLATSRIVYMHNPEIVDSAGDGWTRWGGAFKRGHGQPASKFDSPSEVFGACGAAFMISKALFDELQGFDEDFFLAFEDVDLSYRARLLGYRCFYVPDATVEHAGSATLGRLSAEAVFYGQRNLEWVYLKNTPWPLLLATAPGHVIYNLAAAAYFLKSGRLRPFIHAKAAAVWGIGSVFHKRRIWQRQRKARSLALWRRFEPRSLRLKHREKAFDASIQRLDVF